MRDKRVLRRSVITGSSMQKSALKGRLWRPTEVGTHKRKQEKWENKKTRTRPRDQEKKKVFSRFLGRVLVFFYKFPPLDQPTQTNQPKLNFNNKLNTPKIKDFLEKLPSPQTRFFLFLSRSQNFLHLYLKICLPMFSESNIYIVFYSLLLMN